MVSLLTDEVLWGWVVLDQTAFVCLVQPTEHPQSLEKDFGNVLSATTSLPSRVFGFSAPTALRSFPGILMRLGKLLF